MIRCGIIGMGKMGRIRADEIIKNPDTCLTAIYDISSERMDRFDAKKCKSVDEIMDEKLDVILRMYVPDLEKVKTWQAPKAELL